MGTKRKKYDSVSNAKKEQNAAASHRACFENYGETPLQAALHARQQQAITAGGIVAVEAVILDRAVNQRDETNARTTNANMACEAALGRLDLSELLRKASEAAAKTAEDDSRNSQAAPHSSERRGGRAACVGGIAACFGGARGSYGGGVKGITGRG